MEFSVCDNVACLEICMFRVGVLVGRNYRNPDPGLLWVADGPEYYLLLFRLTRQGTEYAPFKTR